MRIDFKYIYNLLLKRKKTFLWGQVITLFTICVSIPIPLMLPVLVDEVLLNKPALFVNTINSTFGSGNAFYYIAIVTISVILLRFIYFISSVLVTKIFTDISKYITFNIRKTLLLHLQQVSINEYESLGSGAISSNLVTDINTLDNFIITSAGKFIASILSLIAVAIVMIMIDPILGFIILFIQPLITILSKKISKKTGELKRDENLSIEKFQDNISETLDLFTQIKASNKENYFFNHAISKAKKIQHTSNEYSFKSVAYERFSFTVFLSSFEILRASGLLMVVYSDLTIGMMFAMFGYIWFIMTPVQDILSMQYSYASAKAALVRINSILELKKEINGTTNLTLSNNALEIKIENLGFFYTKENHVLKDISFTIKPKEKVALIGASGSGKTTLAQLIAGFYQKCSGDIYYNEINDEKVNKHDVRDKIFLVLQMPILFNQTLRFNITMGDQNITDEQIFKALHIAQLDDMISTMKDSLNTVVGKHGIRLSGGQRQRLSIARMIIANPDVIIFDESTSALDVQTEYKLFIALESFLKEKTVITIAHRLSTVKNANMIYVLNNGVIVQRGDHISLEKQIGHYNEFLKNQLI